MKSSWIAAVTLLLCWVFEAACPAGEIAPTGRRQLPDYEADAYGPLPFPEQVTGFLHHELAYVLGRQNADGSWDSAQPQGGGKWETEAGGTVGNVTLTSMCGYSLRHFDDIDPEVYDDAIRRALLFVTAMVNGGKLRNNVIDAPWHYIYALRFLIAEYPDLEDGAFKKSVEDACAIIVRELGDTQTGTAGERSIPVSWRKRSSPGMTVADTGGAAGVVVRCPPGSPAFEAGVREGDQLITADGAFVDTAVRYAMAELGWKGGDTVGLMVLRGDESLTLKMPLPASYPGTLGLELREADGGLEIAGFGYLSNGDSLPLSVGDRIMSIDGRAVRSLRELEAMSFSAGQSLRLAFDRGGKKIEGDYVCPAVPAADFGVNFPGGRFDQSSEPGLPIAGFAAGSSLKAAGLKPGDRLLRIGGSLILNRRHFRELSRSLPGGTEVEITYRSGGGERRAEVKAGSLADSAWLKGYHGLKLLTNAAISAVEFGSPAWRAGCRRDDKIVEVNGARTPTGRSALNALTGIAAGRAVRMVVERDGERVPLEFRMHRAAESVWRARDEGASGGWGYLVGVKGGNTFTTADALRELLKLRETIPSLEVPDEMLRRAFVMLSELRRKQPNSEVESYRYDAAGSFWGVQDIRADIGRIASAELACLMYSDSDLPAGDHARDQGHLRAALREWLNHRGILDLVKFPNGHGKLSIAPWFWMYSYRTTLEAAAYLTVDDDLRDELQRTALKALFAHMEFRFEPKLGGEGWIIGGDTSKELHDSCQLFDSLATLRHLFGERVETTEPKLAAAMAAFHASRYGECYKDLVKLASDPAAKAEASRLAHLVKARFESRLADVKSIYGQNAFDGVHHLRAMGNSFAGYPGVDRLAALEAEWKQTLPELPSEEEMQIAALGVFPGRKPDGATAATAWAKVLRLDEPGDAGLLAGVDLSKASRRGKWKRVGAQVVSPSEPYARIEIGAAPAGSYRFEAEFTRLGGDCLAVMFPVGETSGLLVVSGWGGEVSGIAFIDGKDANRNETTRDGKLSNAERHSLVLETRLLGDKQARVAVELDGAKYLEWEGARSSLKPDRQWSMGRPGVLGIGAYDATVIVHGCRSGALE